MLDGIRHALMLGSPSLAAIRFAGPLLVAVGVLHL
jgi:hypothetical protein